MSDAWRDADSCGVTKVAHSGAGSSTLVVETRTVGKIPVFGLGESTYRSTPEPGLETKGRKSHRGLETSMIIGSSSRRRPVFTSIQCVREWIASGADQIVLVDELPMARDR